MADKVKPRRLTAKQKAFAEEYVKNGGNGTKAALKAYDTTDYDTASQIGVENLRKPQVRTITEQLFSIEKTQQVVDNLHKLAISAEDEKIQVEATKEWNNRALPKTDVSVNFNFNKTVQEDKDEFGI